MSGFYTKEADEALDFPFDWTASLAESDPDDTISSASAAVVPADGNIAIVNGTTHAAGIHTPELTGGVVGTIYILRSTIITAQGRTDVQEKAVLVI